MQDKQRADIIAYNIVMVCIFIMVHQSQYSEAWFIACVTLGRQEKEVMEESYVVGNTCS